MKYFSLLAILTLLIISCENDLSPLNQDEVFNNLTYFESPEGVIYKLEGLKDIYSLDEKIEAKFTVINKSDTTKYHVFTSSGPVFSFSTFDKNNDRIYYNSFGTATVYNFYFEPDDTLSYSFQWGQYQKSSNHYSSLKAYAGKYFIMPTHVGIPTNNVGKWISVNEVGEPLSTKLYYYFSDYDSLKIDFLVRNRTSNELQYSLDQENPVKVEFFKDSSDELVMTQYPEIDFSNMTFNGMTDYDIFNYRISKYDSIFAGMTGSYNCRITFSCNSREISASSNIIFPD